MVIRRRKPPVGARPGTLVVHPEAPPPKIHVFIYDAGQLDEHVVEDVDQIESLIRDDRVVWIDVQGLGDERILRRLGEIFKIHPLALEDVVNVPSRPKSEAYDDHVLIVTRMLQKTDTIDLDVEQVSIFIGAGYVLTIQERVGDVLDAVRKRLRAAAGPMRRSGPDYLGYAILDTIIDAYYPVLSSIGDYLEAFEDEVMTSADTDTLRQLNRVKNTLITIRRAITPQRDAVNSLIRDDNPHITDGVRIYLRDTHDHCVQMSESVEAYRELVSGLMNTYLSVVSNRMNEVMKVLTIMASIFVPLTFLAGIYGMNFQYMPELQQRWAYPALLIVMASLALGMLVLFWRRGWIGDRGGREARPAASAPDGGGDSTPAP